MDSNNKVTPVESRRLLHELEHVSHVINGIVKDAMDKLKVENPRLPLQEEIKITTDILVSNIRTALESGDSCPDLWAQAMSETMDLALLLRQRVAMGRKPADLLPPTGTWATPGKPGSGVEVKGGGNEGNSPQPHASNSG